MLATFTIWLCVSRVFFWSLFKEIARIDMTVLSNRFFPTFHKFTDRNRKRCPTYRPNDVVIYSLASLTDLWRLTDILIGDIQLNSFRLITAILL